MDDQPYSPAEVWQTAYGELQLQLPRETFDTWLRHARLIAHEDGTFIIGVHNIYAREWLEQRLKKVVIRTLGRITGRSVEARFVLAADHAGRPHPRARDKGVIGPLLAELETEEQEPLRFERLAPGETGLNPRQTFETYAVGASNRLAHSAAVAVVEAPAKHFNPLYIHGRVGLGKSHLLHAIGNAFAGRGQRVLYVTSETFTNDLIAAIRGRSTAEFRDKYRNLDALLVDDMQFIAGKGSTQEEFTHTFNALFNAGAQIVVGAGLAPGDIAGLDGQLRSRFEGGLVVELEPPDYLTRVDILEQKASQRGFGQRLPLDLLERIAERFEGSVRELEGALNRVIASAMLAHETPSAEVAESILEQLRPAASPSGPSLEDVIMAVADFYGVAPEALCGRDRARDVSLARQVTMYIANKKGGVPLQQIGEVMAGRNHSTVLYACERIGDLMATDSQVRRQVHIILQSLLPHDAPEINPPAG